MLFWSGGMCSFLMSLILLFNTVQIQENICEIKKIEYIANNSMSKNIFLNIVVESTFRDVFQLSIYFYDRNKELLNNKCYSSSLVVQGKKNTQAKIPVEIKDTMYLNIIVYSGNLEKEIENIMFPIYPKKHQTCDLGVEKICRDTFPTIINYENKEINEVYNYITLTNHSLYFFCFDNLLPLSKIHLISNSGIDEINGSAIMRVKSEINNELFVPLKIIQNNNLFHFKLAEKYYVNLKEGKTSKNYMKDSYYISEIVFPYIDQEYQFELEITDLFEGFETIVIPFNVVTKGQLLGKCGEAKYCVRRSYL